MARKTKKQLEVQAEKLMKQYGFAELHATPDGAFYTNPDTPKAVHGAKIKIYTFTNKA